MARKVTVYSTRYCPFCSRAKALLTSRKIAFEEIDLTHDAQTREKISSQTGWTTVPMIFIGDEFVGGFDDLEALDRQGQLQAKVDNQS